MLWVDVFSCFHQFPHHDKLFSDNAFEGCENRLLKDRSVQCGGEITAHGDINVP